MPEEYGSDGGLLHRVSYTGFAVKGDGFYALKEDEQGCGVEGVCRVPLPPSFENLDAKKRHGRRIYPMAIALLDE